MGKHVRISDIAKLAGVSAGTVDRIIHNRGNVSKAKRAAVERVLNEIGYERNLHLSSISMNKRYEIAITLPEHYKGNYWADIERGIMRVVKEFDNIDINCTFHYYDQYDVYSSTKAHRKIIESAPDAVIIGPTFHTEVQIFCKELDELKCPYIFVDSYIEGAKPISYYVTHQRSVGAVAGKLLSQVTPEGCGYVHLRVERRGDQSANNVVLRKIGLMGYLDSIGKAELMQTLNFSIDGKDEDENVKEFFTQNPNVKGVVVLSSKASYVSELFKRCNITGIRIVGVDLTEANYKAVKNDEIDYIVCQYPQRQGYLALKNVIHYLLFGDCEATSNFVPITIVTKENLEFYNDI